MVGTDLLKSFSGNLGDDVLGPTYNYHTKIAKPKDLGVSSSPNMWALGRDVNALKDYIKIMVDGTGDANKAGRPLGDKFFLKTTGKCKDVKSKKEVTRYFYVNNQISGKLPIAGFNTGMKGLLIGVLEGVFQLDPSGLFKGFAEGSTPWCKAVTKQVINDKNQSYYETHHVALTDLDPSDLNNSDRKNVNKFKKNLASGSKEGECKDKNKGSKKRAAVAGTVAASSSRRPIDKENWTHCGEYHQRSSFQSKQLGRCVCANGYAMSAFTGRCTACAYGYYDPYGSGRCQKRRRRRRSSSRRSSSRRSSSRRSSSRRSSRRKKKKKK